MKVIVLASSKGGVGKTTLAFNLAVHAAKTSGVQLADLDPQRSLMDLCFRRREMPELVSDNPMILENVDTVGRTVSDLTASGYDRDFLIVDTPGSFMDVLREAIAAADAIVVPLQASPVDYLAQDAVAEMVQKLGKRERTLFVLNRVDVRSSLVRETIAAIRPLSPNAVVKIAQRVDYARAGVTARAGVEINRDAAAEIAALWRAIKKMMESADDKGVHRQHGRSAKDVTRRAR